MKTFWSLFRHNKNSGILQHAKTFKNKKQAQEAFKKFATLNRVSKIILKERVYPVDVTSVKDFRTLKPIKEKIIMKADVKAK